MTGPGPISLARIVRALGGELYDGGRRALVPGPGHSAADRSVSLLLSPTGRVIAHSFAGDDWRAVLDDLRARGLLGADDRPMQGSERPVAEAPLRAARRLWAAGRPIDGTAAADHLLRRGVRRPGPAALRFHAGVPAAVYAGRGLLRPALLAAIQAADGELTGVELTYLAPDGRAAAVRVPRKTVGLRPPGSAVRLDPPGLSMLVGEGVLTCLSASEALALPAWALLAVGNLVAWSPPAGVRRVVVAADRGQPGEAAAARLAQRLAGAGLAVEVRLPPEGFGDWNDAAREGEGEAGKGGPGPGDGPSAGPGASR